MPHSVRGVVATVLLACGVAACSGSKSEARQPADSAAIAAVRPAGEANADPRVTAADQARIKGSPDAKVWVVIASDFECPFCRTWHEQTAAALDSEYVATGKVRVAYVQFPLGQHKHAMPAAEASMCAGAQGKFWPMHDKIFATAGEWVELPDAAAVFARLAGEVGADSAQYAKCMADDVMLGMIESDRQRASKAGVNSTPSFIIGATILSGALPIDQFRPAIDAALAAQGAAAK